MVTNTYIHIPFCRLKCNYCSFISFEKLNLINEYFIALEKEISNFYKKEIQNTIYFGGGTPSLCKISQLEAILNLLNFDKTSEITLEANPNDVNYEYLKNLKSIGFNRISFGVQTFDDNILKIIGRRHNSKEAINSVQIAKKAGFENISCDLIYGLPNQTIEIFKNDLNQLIELDIQHISFYGLKIEEGCKFYKNQPENLPNLDFQADMYELGYKILKENGFEHYEISNFAKKGYESNHNLNYWNNNSYYGFGAGAHGYSGKTRYANALTIEKYLENPIAKSEEKIISETEKLEEEIFLGLRKCSGINIPNINKKFNIDFEKKYGPILKKYFDFFEKKNDNITFTTKGFLISNEILSEFLQ